MVMPWSHRHVQMLSDVRAERIDLADFLESLDDQDWKVSSLCAGWTVHEVVAHLTLSTRQTVGGRLSASPAHAGTSIEPRRIGHASERPSSSRWSWLPSFERPRALTTVCR